MWRVGIVGGTGELGSAIARALLTSGSLEVADLLVSNRTGVAGLLKDVDGLTVTSNLNALVEFAEVILLAVPPAQARTLRLGAKNALVLSVMAGVTHEELIDISGTTRVVRAMSSPAAARQLAFSAWFAPGLNSQDAREVERILSACGRVARVEDEDHINRFTAITGPVPGFVAAFANAVVTHGMRAGLSEELALDAASQLFLSAGVLMAESTSTPREEMDAMIAYAGTTAAGMDVFDKGPLNDAVDAALEAAYQLARAI